MAGIGGRRNRRRWIGLCSFALLLLTVSLAYVGAQLRRGALDPSGTAGLLGLPVGLLALVVSVVALRKPPEGALADLARGWAATLAKQVHEEATAQRRQLLGDDTEPINLAFARRSAVGRSAVTPADRGTLLGEADGVPDVAAYYLRTHPQRMVITGAAGAGKTVLAVELMLALIDVRGEDDPVPVRLSPAEWNTQVSLRDWVIRHLVEAYDWPANMATELVRQHRVLPVLDGLDEMDPTCSDGTPMPDAPRARAALEALNAHQHGRSAAPLVLTCRAAHYEALAGPVRLLDAVRIDIAPVSASDAHAYLHRRATEPARWQPLFAALRSDPHGTLAATLATPWRLCLAATVYGRDGDPAELLDFATPGDLHSHLLARFVPAATALHPNRYAAADVHRWLALLARHLTVPAPGLPAVPGTRTDLVLHQLWPLAGPRLVRAADAFLTALIVLTPLALAWPTSIPTGVGLAVAGIAAAAGMGAARAQVDPPKRVDWRHLRTPAGRRRLMSGLAFGLIFGLTVIPALAIASLAAFEGLALDILPFAALVGGVFGLAAGLVFGLVAGLVGEPTTTANPRSLIRSDLASGLVYGFAFGLTFGLALGLVIGATAGVAVGLGSGLGAGLAIGIGIGVGAGVSRLAPAFETGTAILVGLGLGLVLAATVIIAAKRGLRFTGGGSSGRRYLIFILCSSTKLPRRLGPFLDWACEAGMMRLAGPAYQFRHRELQEWLVIEQPSALPSVPE
ncbi:NACHT domain-containing protein [Streptomyces sp. NPDC002817]|uniref:NACHT domain-containing protein n=1 Tax=Streptomyces sp. NPDC088357 TaxID=3154655 RepID=UPI0034347A70